MFYFNGLICGRGILAGVFALILLAGPAMAGESRFFSELGDVPLMEGLYEVEQETVAFDAPDGRVVESVAVAESSQVSGIIEFYSEILPRLGWVADGRGGFTRQGERLTLRQETRDGVRIVYFSLSPKG